MHLIVIVPDRGLPEAIQIDSGTEFTSKVLDQRAHADGFELDFSSFGKPTDNAFIECFNSRDSHERLNENRLLSLGDAGKMLETGGGGTTMNARTARRVRWLQPGSPGPS